MRVIAIATLVLLALSATPALLPAADDLSPVGEAAAQKCIYGYTPDCIVYNPCNPTYCDPYWP